MRPYDIKPRVKNMEPSYLCFSGLGPADRRTFLRSAPEPEEVPGRLQGPPKNNIRMRILRTMISSISLVFGLGTTM